MTVFESHTADKDPILITKTQKMPLVVACIPAYNEDMTLASVIIKTMRYVQKVVVCDDGSNDMTNEIAAILGAELVTNKNNQGKGAALKSLFERATKLNADIVVTLDADGQHDPSYIPQLIEPIIQGEADVVIGSRFVGMRSEVPFYRNVGLRVIGKVNSRTVPGIMDTQSGYRAFSNRAIEAMLSCNAKGFEIETEELVISSKYNLRVKEVPIAIRYKGLVNTSKKNSVAHGMNIINYALSLIVEKRPLLTLGVPGALLLLVGIASGAYLLWEFNLTRYFSMPIALIAFGTFIIGTFLMIGALMLYGISTYSTHLKNETESGTE